MSDRVFVAFAAAVSVGQLSLAYSLGMVLGTW
jgi:hypothetical protein